MFQPLRDQGEHRMAVTPRGFLRATAGSAGDSISPSRHDAGGPEHHVRCPSGEVFSPQQWSQSPLVYSQGSQELRRRRVLFQRHRMDGPPNARPAITAAGRPWGFSGLSGRRRADNDAGVHHNTHATVTAAAVTASNVTAVTAGNFTAVTVTAVTAAAVTAGNITAVTVTDVTSATITAVTTATVAAGNVTVVTAVTTATATAVSVAVLGGAAGVWPYPLEDDPVFRHADNALTTLEELPLPSPVTNGEAFSHNAGLLSIAGKQDSLSTLDTRGAMDSGRREQLTPAVEDRSGRSFSGGREQLTPAVEDRGGSSCGECHDHVAPTVEDRGEEISTDKSRGIPWAMVAMLATRKDIEATLSDQRPPYKPPDGPPCFARDLKVPRNYTEAMRSEHAHL